MSIPQTERDDALAWAVENDELLTVRHWLDEGADPNARCSRRDIPILFLCKGRQRSGETLDVLDALLESGADPDQCYEGKSMLHAAAMAGMGGVVRQLLSAGADPHLVSEKGRTPLQSALMGNNGIAVRLLNQAVKMPAAALDETLTHAAIMNRPQGDGYAVLDNPRTWRYFDMLVAQLEKNGEPPVTIEDLRRTGAEGVSFMTCAVRSYATSTLLDYLAARGERIATEDLVLPDGKATSLLGALMRGGKVEALFAPEYWKDASPRDLRDFYRALPPEAQQHVPNFHRLSRHLEEKQRQQEQHGIGGRE